MNAKEERNLQFVFTENDFYLDIGMGSESERYHQFEQNRYLALYQMGMEERAEQMSPTENFMQMLADTFFQLLTDLPELEIARERAEIRLGEEEVQRLLDAVPFAIGAEYITEAWLKAVFDRLLAVFAEEVQKYEGTVQVLAY